MTMMLCTLMAATAMPAPSARVEHVHPLSWWAGMKDPILQVMLHGQDIASGDAVLENAVGLTLKETVRVDNPNYLFLYIDTQGAPAQQFTIRVGKQRIPYELQQRESVVRKTFDASDVVYLLMPDRFANGHSEVVTETKNPKSKATPVLKRWAAMREPVCDRNEPFGRHGGDLAGMTQRLDYLADLGVTAVWPTPVMVNDMERESYHGYAITDYYQVDPRFGTNDEYRQFVGEAHRRGLKVIQDMVFNHCGSGNFLFTDMPQRDWFNFQGEYVQSSYKTGAVGDIHASALDRSLTVDGWFVPTMPDLNQRNRLVSDYLIQSSLWWIEWAGIDGIRQDTYPYNDFDAMVRWCERVELEYPGFNIVGEAWINNNVGVAYWQKDSKLSAPLNSKLRTVMDFPLMSLLNSVVDEETDVWNNGYARLHEYLSQDVVYADPNHLLTFLDNHDTDRFQKTPEQAQDTTRYKQALTLLLTLRGIPQIYYGDEVGMAANKAKGDGELRQDFPGGWPGDENDAFTAEGRTPLQNWYFNFARNLLQWRKTNRTVQFGRLVHYHVRNGVYVYARQLDGHTVTVLLNGTGKSQVLDMAPYEEVMPHSQAKNILTHRTVTIGQKMHLRPREVRVLEF